MSYFACPITADLFPFVVVILLWKIYTRRFPNRSFLQFMLLHVDFSSATLSGFDINKGEIQLTFFSLLKACGMQKIPPPTSKPQNKFLKVPSNYDTHFYQLRSSRGPNSFFLWWLKNFTPFRNTCFLAMSDDWNTVIMCCHVDQIWMLSCFSLTWLCLFGNRVNLLAGTLHA